MRNTLQWPSGSRPARGTLGGDAMQGATATAAAPPEVGLTCCCPHQCPTWHAALPTSGPARRPVCGARLALVSAAAHAALLSPGVAAAAAAAVENQKGPQASRLLLVQKT